MPRTAYADIYERVTPERFEKYLKRDDGTNAFIPQKDIGKLFRKTVEACVRAQGELFAHEVEIVTEELSPLAIVEIRRIAKRAGYRVECKNSQTQLEYLFSDGGGHYSTDYYRYVKYGKILATAN